MRCPDCSGVLRTGDTLHIDKHNEIYRKRICTKCGKVLYTAEFEVEPDERFRKEWAENASKRTMYYQNYRRSKTKKEEPKNDYPDPTAYTAIKNIEHETKRVNGLLKTIFSICKMAGFKIEGRIVLKDEKTGRIWR